MKIICKAKTTSNISAFSSFLIIMMSIFLTILFSSCSNTETTFWENGLKKSEITYKRGKTTGSAIWWFSNGNKQMQVDYIKGKIEGKLQRWNFAGVLVLEETYLNDKKNGLSVTWYDSGVKHTEATFIDDILHGEFNEFYPNGEIKINGYYNKGFYDRIWNYYSEIGLTIGRGEYKNGKGVLISWYSNGMKKREIHYQDNEKNGAEIWYEQNGKIEKTITYKNGNIISPQ